MERELFKRNIIQVGVLFIAYYFLPSIIREFIGTDDSLARAVPLVVEVLIAGMIIYKLFELRNPIENQVNEIVNNITKEKLDEVKKNRLSSNTVMLLFVVLISLIGLPIIGNWVSPKVITVLKIIIVGYCLYLVYHIWNLFNTPPPSDKAEQTKP